MEDQQIVALYWQRSAEAITQSKEKYGAYCFSVAEHILQNVSMTPGFMPGMPYHPVAPIYFGCFWQS